MSVIPERDPGPVKTDGGVRKAGINKKTSLVPLKTGASPQEFLGSGTRDRVKREFGRGLDKRTERILYLCNYNESTAKTGNRSSRPDGHSPSSPH
jgi:hypothetical protein